MVFFETNNSNSDLIRIVESEVKFNHPNVEVYIEDSRIGDGTFYLFNDRMVWINRNESNNSFYLDLDSLNLFAICRDLDHFDSSCLLLTAQTDQSTFAKYRSNEEDSYDFDEDQLLVNVRLVPENENEIQLIYDNLKQMNKESVTGLNGQTANQSFEEGQFDDAYEDDESFEEGQFDDAD